MIQFEGAHGDLLAARLDHPPGRARAFALFAHCFTCSKDFVASSRVARGLSALGVSVLRFDFTGLGSSAGDFANTSFSSNVEDLIRAAEFLRREYEPPALLVGHSLGGAAVLAAAGRIPEALAVATIGAPADPAHVTKLFADQRDEILSSGEAEVTLAGRRFRIRQQLLEDLSAASLETAVSNLRKALLVLHSPVDQTVGIENASRLFQMARHPKSFVSLDGADHLLSRPEDAAYVAHLVAAWSSRFLAPEPAAEVPEPRDQQEVVVAESGDGPFGQAIRAGRHRLEADEPVAVGGEDSGPTPYGLLLASLGACTSMTLRLYARRKELPLQHVSVRLRHSKVHASDCEDCEAHQPRVDRIERAIELVGDLDAVQRRRLLEIAERCPVHRTLAGEVRVETRLAE
jgi:putative redox protein